MNNTKDTPIKILDEDKKIKKDFCKSSLIIRADYDPLMENLTVFFRSGGVYEYCGVKKKIFDELCELEKTGESIGKYFHKNIKNVYEFMKKV